jgi:2Fe-2S ferredoxin
MPRVIFRDHFGEQHEVDVPAGVSVMEAAVRNGVRGIDGDCGGAAACATCHVYVDTDWFAATGPQNAMEQSMLTFAEHVGPTSRLGCQIRMNPELDGLTVELPESQH